MISVAYEKDGKREAFYLLALVLGFPCKELNISLSRGLICCDFDSHKLLGYSLCSGCQQLNWDIYSKRSTWKHHLKGFVTLLSLVWKAFENNFHLRILQKLSLQILWFIFNNWLEWQQQNSYERPWQFFSSVAPHPTPAKDRWEITKAAKAMAWLKNCSLDLCNNVLIEVILFLMVSSTLRPWWTSQNSSALQNQWKLPQINPSPHLSCVCLFEPTAPYCFRGGWRTWVQPEFPRPVGSPFLLWCGWFAQPQS